jgi:hypothetical protein
MKDKPRAPISRNVGGSRKKKWTRQEDLSLDLAVRRLGTDSWRHVALLVTGRSSKQCRERWLAHFSPDIVREGWTPDEDLIILEKQRELGNQWVKIKAFLPRRSLVAVKNRWNWLCRRDIPNHSVEFRKMVRSHGKVEDEGADVMLWPWADDSPNGLDEFDISQFPFRGEVDIPVFEF